MKLKQMSPQIDAASLEMRRDVKDMRAALRKFMTVTMVLLSYISFADVTVSDVQVFSGHPWKEVVVGYTITGTSDRAYSIRLRATDHSAKKTYTTQILKDAELTEGRHVLRWEASAEGVRFSSTNVVFTVSLVGAVQLWGGGPYWSECNIGADKPEDYGYYFWWGDTVGCKRNAANDGWISVKDGSSFTFVSGNCPTNGKDIPQLLAAGYINAAQRLVAAHDAARAYFGAPWRMPTVDEFDGLINYCDTTWTQRNGVWGRLVTGRGAYASKSIFLPAAGYGSGSNLDGAGSSGDYWSSKLYSDYSSYFSCYFWLGSTGRGWSGKSRIYGLSVRPVRSIQ